MNHGSETGKQDMATGQQAPVDLSVRIGSLTIANPVMSASGCFGGASRSTSITSQVSPGAPGPASPLLEQREALPLLEPREASQPPPERPPEPQRPAQLPLEVVAAEAAVPLLSAQESRAPQRALRRAVQQQTENLVP